MVGAVIGAAAWLAAAGALAAAAMLGALPAGAEGVGVALAASVMVLAPVAIGGLAIWLRVGARRDRTELSVRIAAVDAAVAAAVEAAQAEDAAAPAAAGVDGDALARALSNAAREALDAEREAIARRMAELAETQRRLDAAVTALGSAIAEATAPMADESLSAERDAAAAPAGAEARSRDAEPFADAVPRASVPAAPPRAQEEDARQPGLPLSDEGTPGQADLDWGVVASALDFPRHAGDAEGFAALDAARRDRGVAELLRAAEDALTLLSQKGLYMEDLEVRHAPTETWRRFAQGARGPSVRAAGGVEAAEAVATVRELMKSDPVFRDTALHLMRRYDALLRRTVNAPQGEARLLSFADSRTGRAFMTVAQASGVFD